MQAVLEHGLPYQPALEPPRPSQELPPPPPPLLYAGALAVRGRGPLAALAGAQPGPTGRLTCSLGLFDADVLAPRGRVRAPGPADKGRPRCTLVTACSASVDSNAPAGLGASRPGPGAGPHPPRPDDT